MKRPKRRKSKYNPYTLEDKNTIAFIDGVGIRHVINISDELFKEFNNYELQDLKEMNEYDRHIEHLELTDELLYQHTKNHYDSLEDIVLKNIILERLYYEIDRLPILQKRRLKMYFFDNLTLQEIAKKENCTKMAIKFSIDSAIKTIYQKLKF